MVSRPTTGAELVIVWWAVLGMVAILVQAIVRLLPRALEPILEGAAGELGPLGALAYGLSIVSLAYSEGYRGFQQRFSPRVVVRALALLEPAHRRSHLIALAPLMVMGLIYANRRRLLGSWGLVLAIVALVLLVSLLDQPWRGAVDAGVVVGLSWGTIATLVLTARALRGDVPHVDPDLPELS